MEETNPQIQSPTPEPLPAESAQRKKAMPIMTTPPTYVGRVICEGEHNYHDDSDFYAIVWCDETNQPKEVGTWTTRCGGGVNAIIDADEPTLEKYRAYCKQKDEERYQARRKAEHENPTKGKHVTITGGRKYKGRSGVIIWRGVNQFGTYYRNGYNRPDALHNQRVGVKCDQTGEIMYTAATQVTVDTPMVEEVEA